jgi:hypothetical protein
VLYRLSYLAARSQSSGGQWLSISARPVRRPDESDETEGDMKRLFLIQGRGQDRERIAEREAARRAHLRVIRERSERHGLADPRVRLADDVLARRFEAA